MLTRERILRDYREAGGVNGLLALWGFVDDDVFLTKAGHVGLVYRVRGIDPAGLTHPQRRTLTHRVETAVRVLDEHCRLYQYLVKQVIQPIVVTSQASGVAHEAIQQRAAYLNDRRHSLYDQAIYFVLVYERPRSGARDRQGRHIKRTGRHIRRWFSTRAAVTFLETELDRAITVLREQAQAVAIHLSDFGPQRLEKRDIFRFLRQLVNLDRATADAAHLTYDAHLDYFVADAAIECHRDHLVVGDRFVKALSMKEPPARTFAHVLGDLHTIPGEFIACLEWQRIPHDRMRRDLRMRRRHFFNTRVSLVNYVAADAKPEDMLIDESATSTMQQLGEALTELEVHGHFFGLCSLTLVLHGVDAGELHHSVGEARKVIAAHDGALFEETYNLLNAWLSTVPGNGAHNLRRLAVMETNLADLSFVFTPNQGERVSPHLGDEALAIFETPQRTPYAFNLHVQDVGHTLVLGATGSGKTFLQTFLVMHAQQYEPVTVILDLGQSYRTVASRLGGRYLELGLRQQRVTINPFALEPTPEHLHFLHAFVRVLLEGGDAYRLTEREDREIYDAIENLYVLQLDQRRLFTVANLLPRALAGRLHKWVDGGRYAVLFDNVTDTLTVERIQVFDFEAMRAYPDVLEPLLFYVLHRITARITDPEETRRFKLCVIDEAWRFIQHPTLRAYVQEALKTWRKHNAAMMLSTQTIDDFMSVDLLRTVIESCPTKLLLANPALDRRQYTEVFQLNEMELDLLAGLVPRQQMLLKRPDLTKVLSLTVDPKSAWIYTNTPVDHERVGKLSRQDRLGAGLDRLAASAS